MATQNALNQRGSPIRFEDPPVAKMLFGDVRLSWLWLIVRLYVGYEWFLAGWNKVQNPAWFGSSAGGALAGFLKGALAKSTGEHPDVQGWYAAFLQNVVLPNASLWSNIVVVGEILVGIRLILGIFTGIAALFGSFMNFNYLLAGTVSTNPIYYSWPFSSFWPGKQPGGLALTAGCSPSWGHPGRQGRCLSLGGKSSS